MRNLTLLLVASTLAACSTATEPVGRSERAEARLQQELEGLVVGGPPQACMPHYRADQMIVIDDRTILFRDGNNRVWRNEVQGNCDAIGAGNTLVLRSSTGSLCRGEIGEIVHLGTGTRAGSCVLGDFIPYVRP